MAPPMPPEEIPDFANKAEEIAYWERKLEVVRCYESQLRPDGPDDRGQHFVSGSDILQRMETKARSYGERIGVRYGEPFLSAEPLACADPSAWFLA